MSDNQVSSTIDASKLLFNEELRWMPENYRGYFQAKRYNFIATLNNYPDITELYFQGDEIWIQALQSLERVTKGEWILPIQLTIFCFRELRLSAELLFSCCTNQGFSHLRTALEAFTQAQKIIREPSLGSVFLNRDQDRIQYDKHFKANKKAELFPESAGLDKLHDLWSMLCETGPHSNVTALGISSSTAVTGVDVSWRLEFFQVDQGEVTKNLLVATQLQLELFKHTYNVFHDRLSLHPDLLTKLHAQLASYSRLNQKYVSASTS